MIPLDDIRDDLLAMIASADASELREIEVMLHELRDIVDDNLAAFHGGGGDY